MPVLKEFGPDPNLKKLYILYAIAGLFGGIFWWAIPSGFIAWLFLPIGIEITTFIVAFVIIFALIPLAITAYWIPAFCSSVKYVLEDDEIIVVKGVWWKTKSVVPYNRVTNVNIDQGPISRKFGLAKLSVQTAGFSGQTGSGGRRAEATIFGIKNFEEIREFVMKMVRGQRPVAVEAAPDVARPDDINLQILKELRKIREQLKK